MAKRTFTIGEIRDIRSSKSSTKDLSLYYGVCQETIRRVIRAETYAAIPTLQTRTEEDIQASAQRLLSLQQAITPIDPLTIPIEELSPEERAKARIFGTLLGETK